MSASTAIDPTQGRTFTVDGYAMHYHDLGSGSPLVLLHGGGPGAAGWTNYARNIDVLSARHRVLIIDQAGYGLSDKPDIPFSDYFAFNARAIIALLDHLELDHTALVGNSLGGQVALRVALLAPERVERLVLMGSGGALPILSPQPSEGGKILRRYYLGEGPSPEKMRAMCETMVFDPALIDDAIVTARHAASTAPGAQDSYLRMMKSAQTPSGQHEELWRELHRVRQPVLLVWGRDDRVAPLDGSFFMLRQLADARLHVFGRCGHWAQFEHADAFNRLALDFLSGSEREA